MKATEQRSKFVYGGDDGEKIRPFQEDMTFFAENSEAYGLISDARPLAKKGLVAVANGGLAWEREDAPGYEMSELDLNPSNGELFRDLFSDSDEAEAALKLALGYDGQSCANPVSRYFAALAEIVAFQLVEAHGADVSHEQIGVMLNRELKDKLSRLRKRLAARVKDLDKTDDSCLSVSLCVCNVRTEPNEEHVVDVFAAGNYRVYLLDEQGMSPVWNQAADSIVAGGEVHLVGRRFRLQHPKPFALLLLSEGVYDLSPSEYHTLQESGGMIWRYRMRLEDQFIRLVTDCVHDYEFGTRATRFFSGRSRERKSASGALSVHLGGSSFEVFRSKCRARLTVLEKLISLLPKGYDPRRVRALPPRIEAETEHLRRLMDKSPTLRDHLRDALRQTALDARENGFPPCAVPPPEGVPAYRRPDWDEVKAVFELYDGENHDDRCMIEENRRMLRELLSEHWVTLRSLFEATLSVSEDPEGARIHGACLDMSRGLSRMLTRRRNTLACLEESLTDSLDILRSTGNDWICGRAGMESVTAWTEQLNERLPALLEHLHTRWAADTEAYRSLHSAYTAERERLFRWDTRRDGFFAEVMASLLEGTTSPDTLGTLRGALADMEEPAAYLELWDSVCRLSRGIDALQRRIRSRAAESRAARDIANRPELCLDALRGAAYEDPAWGESVLAVMDVAARNDFRATVRRWQESTELARRQAEAYGDYSALYNRYL